MATPKFTRPTIQDPGEDWVPLTLSGADLDLSDPDGPTGGFCARSLYVTVGGVVKFDTLRGTGRNPTVGDKSYVPAIVKKVYATANGTTATGVWAII